MFFLLRADIPCKDAGNSNMHFKANEWPADIVLRPMHQNRTATPTVQQRGISRGCVGHEESSGEAGCVHKTGSIVSGASNVSSLDTVKQDAHISTHHACARTHNAHRRARHFTLYRKARK